MHVPVIAWWVLALVAVRLAFRPLLALVFGGRIGAAVAAKQPDTVHLVPSSASEFRMADGIERGALALMQAGFSDAGWFKAPEMPDFGIRILANEAEGLLANLYEHRVAGLLVEINARFPDGSRACWVNSRNTGLAPLPNMRMTYMTGAPVEAVLAAARKGVAKIPLTPLSLNAATAPRVFEEGYAQLTALRKAQGISRREVVEIAARRPFPKDKHAA